MAKGGRGMGREARDRKGRSGEGAHGVCSEWIAFSVITKKTNSTFSYLAKLTGVEAGPDFLSS